MRVSRIGNDFCRCIGVKGVELIKICFAGQVHDIGKFSISSDLLAKPGELTAEEIDILHSHSELGAIQLSKSSVISKDIIDIVRHHHESYDGSGYPDGLRKGQIPFGARILKICDVYDALTNRREYRRIIYRKDIALQVMQSMKNEFDPELLEKFNRFVIFSILNSPPMDNVASL